MDEIELTVQQHTSPTAEVLAALLQQHGTWVYLLLFVIIFCETGLVVAPFLLAVQHLFQRALVEQLQLRLIAEEAGLVNRQVFQQGA